LIVQSSSPARKRRRRSRSPGALHDASASFEPSVDYVVTKIPRFAFEKFPQADPTLTTQMKSVGEAMAGGRRPPVQGKPARMPALAAEARHSCRLNFRQSSAPYTSENRPNFSH
jgi:hypothetical protein